MKLQYNLITVLPDKPNTTIKVAGVELSIANVWEEYKHAITSGIVTGVPMRNYYNPDDPLVSLPHDTPMELKEGDRVIFHYLAIKKSMIQYNDSYVIPYDQVFCAIRDGQVIPVNGWVIVEADRKDEYKDMGAFIVPDSTKNKVDECFGTVLWVGQPLYAIAHDPDYEVLELDHIYAGDRVGFNPHYAVPLEYSLHGQLDTGSQLYRIQHRNIIVKE